MHLTSLPGDFGIGEMGASSYRFIDLLSFMGLSVWQFLPIGPTAYADSPYQSSSSYAGNPLLIDLATLRDEGLVTDSELTVFRGLPHGTVDFGELIPLKQQLLMRVGERFASLAARPRWLARQAFVARYDQGWLHDFALYQVLKSLHQQQTWLDWEPMYAGRHQAALQALQNDAREKIDCIKTIQYLFFEQWERLRAYAASRGIRLMGDLPIYVAMDSADAWARPDLLNLHQNGTPVEVAGVPPDYFSEDGQSWGNPLYRWDRHSADGFQWWISRLGHAISLFDMVRLDHFRGFEAYWAVPADAQTARDGEWLQGPGAALFNALQDALGRLPIIAEDLGVITPAVDALREQFGLPGMKVLQFMVDDAQFDLANISRDCVCYTGTADNDTTQGWFQNGLSELSQPDTAQRVRNTVLQNANGQAETIHQDLIRLAMTSEAALAMAPMQDYLGLDSRARMNKPGTTRNNWRWRLRQEQADPHIYEWVRRLVTESGRGGDATLAKV